MEMLRKGKYKDLIVELVLAYKAPLLHACGRGRAYFEINRSSRCGCGCAVMVNRDLSEVGTIDGSH